MYPAALKPPNIPLLQGSTVVTKKFSETCQLEVQYQHTNEKFTLIHRRYELHCYKSQYISHG